MKKYTCISRLFSRTGPSKPAASYFPIKIKKKGLTPEADGVKC